MNPEIIRGSLFCGLRFTFMAMPHQKLPSYRSQTAMLAERRPFLASHPPQCLSQSSTLPLLKKSVPVQPQISREHTRLPICWKWAVSQAPCHTLSWEPLHLLVVPICTKPSVHRLWAALETPYNPGRRAVDYKTVSSG